MQEAARPNRRQLQAAQTRRDILDTAARLFTERGYARTSVADIARETGVSVQTIYGSVGQKHQIMGMLLDDIDERAGIIELAAQVPVLDDPVALIRLQAQLTRQLNERYHHVLSGLWSGRHVEPELARAWDEGMSRHRGGSIRIAQRLHALGALRSGIDVDTAAAALDVMSGAETWIRLKGSYGWTYERIEDWIVTTLTAALLREAR
jgi:AcrR family transcriptional regulator